MLSITFDRTQLEGQSDWNQLLWYATLSLTSDRTQLEGIFGFCQMLGGGEGSVL
jgi:hypothetical protein